MKKVLIVDDEYQAREVIKSMLKMNFSKEIEIIGEADSVKGAISFINKHPIDILFLDIKMPDGSGLDIFDSIQSYQFETIFTTAHDEYAVQAFQISAMGYLLKPIDMSQLIKTCEKALYSVTKKESNIKILLENVRLDGIHKIVIPHSEGFYISEISDILFIEADVNYSKFYFMNSDKTILSSKTLKEFETSLENLGFFRAHKSYLINLKHVVEYKKSSTCIKMKNGQEIPLSRQRKQDFQDIFR